MRIGYLGPEGTYTEEAARILAKGKHVFAPFQPIGMVFQMLDRRDVDLAVVPMRNSIAGDYTETFECIGRYTNINIKASTDLLIRLALGIHLESNIGAITDVLSKDTALRECSDYLGKQFPSAKRTETPSTAYAMREIRDKRLVHAAAIGSIVGLRTYGLQIIADDIGNQKDNFTTFLLLDPGLLLPAE